MLKAPFFIHPFAAQLLFFTGVAIGIYKRDIEAFIAAHSGKVLIAATLFLIAADCLSQVAWSAETPYEKFSHKYYLNPMRLAELLAVMAIIWCLVKPQTLARRTPTLIELCGRHTLPVFAITTVGAVFFTYLNHWLDAGPLVYGLCILANIALCLASGHMLEQRRVSHAATAIPGRRANSPQAA